MNTEYLSIDELEKKIDKIEQIVDKVEFISTEILRCKKAIQEVKCEVEDFPTTEIVLTTKTKRNKNSFIELLNIDNKVKHNAIKVIKEICTNNICNKYVEFLERAESHLQHYKTIIETRFAWNEYADVERSTNKQDNSVERIIWRKGISELLELFEKLYENEIVPKYSKKEILLHFVDEKQNPFCKETGMLNKFCWLDTDSSFSIFVDELAKRGAIYDEDKYKIFTKHFVNKKGQPFKYLAQKRNHTINFSQAGNLIREIFESIKKSSIILLVFLIYELITSLDPIIESISVYIVM